MGTASCAVDALAAEVHRRSKACSPPNDLTIIVLYLAGERYVREAGTPFKLHEPSFEALRQVHEHLAGCGCMHPIAAAVVSEPKLEKAVCFGSFTQHSASAPVL